MFARNKERTVTEDSVRQPVVKRTSSRHTSRNHSGSSWMIDEKRSERPYHFVEDHPSNSAHQDQRLEEECGWIIDKRSISCRMSFGIIENLIGYRTSQDRPL